MTLGLAAASCAQPNVDSSAGASPAAVTAAATGTSPGNLDVLFMIDNSSSMTVMQQKLASQIPSFLTALQNLPMGLPNIHIAVVSSDMGAPGTSTSSIIVRRAVITASSSPEPPASLTPTVASVAPPVSMAAVRAGAPVGTTPELPVARQPEQRRDVHLQRRRGRQLHRRPVHAAVVHDRPRRHGCGFENQLASISRALGADGTPAPSSNAGFLRPDAQLAIVVLSNEDDCSAPANTTLYSLNGGQQNIANPLGPIANYRCNQFGHLCVDPAASGVACFTAPPLNRPPTRR